MAETLVSPGVLANENDQSLISTRPIQAGYAIVGPTVKGPVERPTLVTTYSQYKNIFGTTFNSGSREYTYLTSISAYNYFQQGGASLLVTRVTSGSFSPAVSADIATGILTNTDLSSLVIQAPSDASASVYRSVSATTNGSGVNATFDVTIENDVYGTTGYGTVTYFPQLVTVEAVQSGYNYFNGE